MTIEDAQEKTTTRKTNGERVHRQHVDHFHGAQALAGGVAAFVTRFVCQPFDVLKIRFQLQVEPMGCHKSKYVSMPQAVRTIFRDEGVAGFWKGHMPGQLLSIVYGVFQFWAFEECKDHAKRLNLYHKNENIANFVCGSMAGALGTGNLHIYSFINVILNVIISCHLCQKR